MVVIKALLSALIGIFSYSRRSDRLEQWLFTSVTAVLGGIGFLYWYQGYPVTHVHIWVAVVLGTWFFLAHVALFARRFHDHGRSGFWLLIPLFGLNAMFVAWLTRQGLIFESVDFFMDYALWIKIGTQAFTSLSVAGILVPVFVAQGDEGENEFGDPVE